jgi:rRNA maturation protein Nop10
MFVPQSNGKSADLNEKMPRNGLQACQASSPEKFQAADRHWRKRPWRRFGFGAWMFSGAWAAGSRSLHLLLRHCPNAGFASFFEEVKAFQIP